MAQRMELLEAALEQFPEGIAILGLDGELVFWNRAAEQITGYAGVELVSRRAPDALEPLLQVGQDNRLPAPYGPAARGPLVHVQHKRGHEFAALAQALVLRDGLGRHLGTGIVFHSVETMDALPHGEADNDETLQESQTELEERLDAAYKEFIQSAQSLSVLWITVDQAHLVRRTHGAGACEAMLQKTMRTLATGLMQGEQIGRWGDDEFLVVCPGSASGSLAEHAQRLAGLTRTTDFRWWGDRLSITVSVGAAKADKAEPLTTLLERARNAMHASLRAGGNHITLAPGRHGCSRS